MNEEEKNEQKDAVKDKAAIKEQKKKEKTEKKAVKKAAGSNDAKVIIIIVALVILVALAIFGYFIYNKNLKPVVKYDGGSISEADYEIYYRTFAPMLQMYGYDSAGISELIAQKAASDAITVAAARKAGIRISDEDKAYVDEIFSDDEQLQMFRDAGIDPVRMKQFYYNDYIMDDYIKSLSDNLSDEEVKNYITQTYGEDADMREYVTNHILFLKTDRTTGESYSEEQLAAIKQKAEEVLARAVSGEDFESLAKEFSEDGTASQGGRYNVYLDDNTVKEYVDAATSLEVGSIYPTIVETTYGFHIIKLSEYNENGRVHSEVERQQIANNKIDKMIEDAKIEVKTDVMNEIVKKITGASNNNSNADDGHNHTDDENSSSNNTNE